MLLISSSLSPSTSVSDISAKKGPWLVGALFNRRCLVGISSSDQAAVFFEARWSAAKYPSLLEEPLVIRNGCLAWLIVGCGLSITLRWMSAWRLLTSLFRVGFGIEALLSLASSCEVDGLELAAFLSTTDGVDLSNEGCLGTVARPVPIAAGNDRGGTSASR